MDKKDLPLRSRMRISSKKSRNTINQTGRGAKEPFSKQAVEWPKTEKRGDFVDFRVLLPSELYRVGQSGGKKIGAPRRRVRRAGSSFDKRRGA